MSKLSFSDNLTILCQRQQERATAEWEHWHGRLQGVSPLQTLARGYAIVRTAEGELVRSVQQIAPAQLLHLQLVDGQVGVEVMH